ncbi:GATA transcription factor 8-like isoform X1 [Bidens hawaiensis]|uniref:GATA transcription factor 8-like isoform X1 n=1 Tax=Bidens hawaiensis TaxID=980011 RepID=UPI00404A9E27
MTDMEEIDCLSFFDHIDDLVEFPAVEEAGVNPVDCNEFPNTWTDELPVSDPVFGGGSSDNDTGLAAEIAVPYEDIVQLEWLSNFVEDSFSGGGMTINENKIPVKKETTVAHHPFKVSSPVSVLESSSSSSSSASYSGPLSLIQRGPQRARTKRPRPVTFNPRAMVELLSPMVIMPVEKNFTSCCGPGPDLGKKKKTKKPKTQEENENDSQNENENQSGQGVRKCLHCEITKTPQWRAGPLGPKTLCNACGVRYKSGRLFPEYRPAASPTFVPTLHSNSHKKVVEMRTKFGPSDEMVTVRPANEPELIPNMNPQVDYV